MVYAAREGDEAMLEVTDNGPGMTEAVLGRLYQPFFRAPEARGLPGQGLGLATTKRLVDAHGGTLRIRSAPGVGTTATVRFRFVELPRTESDAPDARRAGRSAGIGPMSLPAILVVDDDPHARGLLRRLLGQLGQVSEAASAPAAEELLRTGAPVDVVLTDMAMPDPDDGLRVLRAALARNADTPVIVLTAFGNIEGALDTIQKGAFDYLTKPFDVDAIVRVVRRALEQRRLVEENKSLRARVKQQELVGRSPAILEVYKQVARAAATNVPVLITGETGTGKEQVARSLHQRSPAERGPLRGGGLRGHRRVADGERAVRPRPRRLHRRVWRPARASSRRPPAGRCSSTRLATSGRRSRASSCARCRRARFAAWARARRSRSTSASSPRRTRISRPGSPRGSSARTCSTGSTWCTCTCRRCASGARTSPRWSSTSRRCTPAEGRGPVVTEEAMGRLVAYDWPGNVRQLENVVARALALNATGVLGPGRLPARPSATRRRSSPGWPRTCPRSPS